MQSLDKSLRSRLERTIKDARDIAEDATRAALEQLGVGEAAPFAGSFALLVGDTGLASPE